VLQICSEMDWNSLSFPYNDFILLPSNDGASFLINHLGGLDGSASRSQRGLTETESPSACFSQKPSSNLVFPSPFSGCCVVRTPQQRSCHGKRAPREMPRQLPGEQHCPARCAREPGAYALLLKLLHHSPVRLRDCSLKCKLITWVLCRQVVSRCICRLNGYYTAAR